MGRTILMPRSGVTVCAGQVCSLGETCCFTTGRCYNPASASECPTPPRISDSRACGSNAHCSPTELCLSQWCLGAGTCRPQSEIFGPTATICGCDGRTWTSARRAAEVGVRVSSLWNESCGTNVGPGLTLCGIDAQCPAGQVCCKVTGMCADPAAPERCSIPPAGTRFPCLDNGDCKPFGDNLYCTGLGCTGGGGCRERLADCPGPLAPVCGCDQQSYESMCWAGMAGVRIAHNGTCP
jgi:hypothetical protein